MQKVAFHAINGVGLGHVARLSTIQKYLCAQLPGLETRAYCRSRYGGDFFTCPCVHVPRRGDLKRELGVAGLRGHLGILHERFFSSDKTTFVFDTFWSNSVAKLLKFAGHKLILVLQSHKPNEMFQVLSGAVHLFDHIIFPCEWQELEYHYKGYPELWRLIEDNDCMAVGPVVRTMDARDQEEKVIFTVGAGGDHKDEPEESSTAACIRTYVAAGELLHEAGRDNLYLAKGPLLDVEMDLGHLEVLETLQLPEYFGENTTVVTRGTYNLGWEAIAAGAKLVTSERSAVSSEHARGRNRYLDEMGYAYAAALEPEAIAEAVLRQAPAKVQHAATLVNERVGLAKIAEIIRGT